MASVHIYVYMYNDYCPEVMDQRPEYKEYKKYMHQLYTLKLKPSLMYPAQLFITADDGMRQMQFLASLQKSRPLVEKD